MKKILYVLPILLLVLAIRCSKTLPTGMKCDYAPYSYATSVKTQLLQKNAFGIIDTNSVVSLVVADSTINKVVYAVLLTTVTSSKGSINTIRTAVRCGGEGVFQSAVIGGTLIDVKVLKANPAVGETWTQGPFLVDGANTTQSFTVKSTTESITVQGISYTNIVKVRLFSHSVAVSGGGSSKAYTNYYWDKTNGIVKSVIYYDESDADAGNSKFNANQELVSITLK